MHDGRAAGRADPLTDAVEGLQPAGDPRQAGPAARVGAADAVVARPSTTAVSSVQASPTQPTGRPLCLTTLARDSATAK